MLKCGGCGSVSFRQRTWMDEEERSEADLKNDFGDDWKDYLTTAHYPPVMARATPGWMSP